MGKVNTKLVLLVTAVASLFASQAFAATVEYDYNTIYASSGTPGGTGSSWLTALFEDVSGGVKLTLTADNLASQEFVSKWVFDFSPDVSFSAVQTDSADSAAKINYLKTVLGTKMDILFCFPTSNSSNRLTDDETVQFLLTGSGISASSFANAFSAAHIQGIGTDGEGSAWVTTSTPEPVSAGLFLLGGGALAFIRRKHRS